MNVLHCESIEDHLLHRRENLNSKIAVKLFLLLFDRNNAFQSTTKRKSFVFHREVREGNRSHTENWVWRSSVGCNGCWIWRNCTFLAMKNHLRRVVQCRMGLNGILTNEMNGDSWIYDVTRNYSGRERRREIHLSPMENASEESVTILYFPEYFFLLSLPIFLVVLFNCATLIIGFLLLFSIILHS